MAELAAASLTTMTITKSEVTPKLNSSGWDAVQTFLELEVIERQIQLASQIFSFSSS
jgi:hypothetical protein